jgi:hypothetical protein
MSGGSDREVCVVTNGTCDDAVERGVLRAVLKLTGHGSAKTPGAGWIRTLLRKKK